MRAHSASEDALERADDTRGARRRAPRQPAPIAPRQDGTKPPPRLARGSSRPPAVGRRGRLRRGAIERAKSNARKPNTQQRNTRNQEATTMPSRAAERRKQRYAEDPVFRAKVLETNAAWADRNRDKINTRQRVKYNT